MITAEFAVNARDETVSEKFIRTLEPWGYLIPPNGLTRRLRQRMETLVDTHCPIIVDNGNFDDIARLTTEFATPIAHAQDQLTAIAVSLKRKPEWRDLPKSVQRARYSLATTLATRAKSVQGLSFAEQSSLASDAAIGAEDITAAVWMSAGLDSPPMPALRIQLRLRNNAVATKAAGIVHGIDRRDRDKYLAVASAVDYDSAFDAGHTFARAGLTRAAMGFGAFMADNSYVARIVVNGRKYTLPRPLPARYLRTALVARGFWDGWREATGSAPKRFHFLGLGAAIMIPLVALAACGTPILTFDATSPMRDAVEGTLYSSKGAYLKIRTRRFAWRLSTGQLPTWNCPCGFCRQFEKQYAFDYALGRQWGNRHPLYNEISAKEMQPGGALYKAYPLLSEPKGGSIRKDVSSARSGHNHWVLSRIMQDVHDNSRNFKSLKQYATSVVESYKHASSDSVFSEAVVRAKDVVLGRFA